MMYTLFKRSLLITSLCALSIAHTAQAQTNFDFDPAAWLGLDQILQGTTEQISGGANDGFQYVGAYLRPLGESLVVGMNNGWYSTAANHETLGFDLSTTTNLVLVPESLSSFEVASLGLTQFQTDATTLPNVFGGSTDSARFTIPFEFEGQEYEVAGFDALGGVRTLTEGLENARSIPVPVPTFNATIGTIKNTDVSLRFMGLLPSATRGFNAFSWGLGVKHDVKQWIPVVKKLPLDLSAFVGYTNSRFSVSATPGNLGDLASLTVRGHSLTGQLLVSKKLMFFTPYAGLGFNLASSTTRLGGGINIPTFDFNPDDPLNPIQTSTAFGLDALEPIRYQANGARATLGAQIKVWVFTIYGDYTVTSSGYNLVSVGSGITWR